MRIADYLTHIFWKILRNYGVPEKTVVIVKCLCVGSTSAVRVEEFPSKVLLVNTGVLQRDTFAPFLFVIIELNLVLQKK